MTQADYNALPLLLPRHAVFAALPVLTQRALYEYRQDGDLRVFEPDPERSSHGYYYKADVGRIHGGLSLEFRISDFGLQIEEWIGTGAFCAVSGLCVKALDRACASGQLVALRQRGEGGHRQFWARDLEWFW